MSKMPLRKSFADALLHMTQGARLNASVFADKKKLGQFISDGMIRKVPAGGRRYRYIVPDGEALARYLAVNYQIHSLREYVRLLDKETVSGEEALGAGYSTKTRRSRVFTGFFLTSIEALTVPYGEGVLSLPPPKGTGCFVFAPEALAVPPEATVVGVENPEVFQKIRRLAGWFVSEQPCVFVLRYMSKGLCDWLAEIPNTYLHFGDFDLSGLAIYIREYRSRLPASRCRFFLPPQIERYLSRWGNAELYEKQLSQTRSVAFHQYPEIAPLAEEIKRHRKGLEQEFLLRIN